MGLTAVLWESFWKYSGNFPPANNPSADGCKALVTIRKVHTLKRIRCHFGLDLTAVDVQMPVVHLWTWCLVHRILAC